ncbi:MAG: extracellular solute-binding protein [Gluconacetobacter liquefaciens]
MSCSSPFRYAFSLCGLVITIAVPQAQEPARAASARHHLVVMGYRDGGFEDCFKTAVIAPFQATHPDISVTYYGVDGASDELGLLRMQKDAPQVDVVITDISVANIMAREALIQAPATPPVNLVHLGRRGRELGAIAPPFTYDYLALTYARPLFPQPPDSWRALWDKAWSGQIIVPAEGGGDIQALSLTLIATHLAGGDIAGDNAQGIDSLVRLAPHVQTFEPHPDQFTLVTNGTAALAVGWNARAQHMAHLFPDRLGVVLPREGTVTQINVIALIAGGHDPEASALFENEALGASAQTRFSGAMYYVPTNQDATPPADLLAEITPAESHLLPVNWLDVSHMRRRLLRRWKHEILVAGQE